MHALRQQQTSIYLDLPFAVASGFLHSEKSLKQWNVTLSKIPGI